MTKGSELTLQFLELVQLVLPFILAFAVGGLGATAELFHRYPDSPVRIFKFAESYFYLLINGGASILAYTILRDPPGQGSSPYIQAVYAGLFGLAIIRSSVANLKSSKGNFQLGPGYLLQIFLDKTDREFDRQRSEHNSREISKIMEEVDFTKAVKNLPVLCLALMENVDDSEQNLLAKYVGDLEEGDLDPRAKSIILGTIIARITGNDLLKSAVNTLGSTIQKSKNDTPSKESTYISEELRQIHELKKKLLGVSE